MSRPRVSYVVSRFPAASETFVVREINEVDDDGRLDLDLISLFPSGDELLHPSAERWTARQQRVSPRGSVGPLLRRLVRSPLRTLRVFAAIVRGNWRRPPFLARSLSTGVLGFGLAELAEERGTSHLHAHFAAYPTLAAWVCSRLTGASYSFTAHAYDIFIEQGLLATKIADASFVVAISEFNREFLRPYAGDSGTPIEVVHCGVDPSAYPFAPREIPPEGPVSCLTVAGLRHKKGHAVLLDAIAGDPALERLQLRFAGGGEEREALEHRARELGIADRVEFLGAQTEEEVRGLLAAADLFVLPSIIAANGEMEGLPVALIEALACGVPVVATRMSGIPELIRDERVGLLAEPGDPGSLAATLRRALEGGFDPAEGRAIVEREFDVRDSGARMTELLLATTEGSR